MAEHNGDAWRAERAAIYTEGVTAALLVNGAAAVALLAFLQSVWGRAEAPIGPILLALAALACGVLSAALINPFRYMASLRSQSSKPGDHNPWAKAVLRAHFVSLAAFFLAVTIVVFGFWLAAPP